MLFSLEGWELTCVLLSSSLAHCVRLSPSPTAHFRLFIGDLDPALSDDLFVQAFSGVRYKSFVKAKIIRDKYTNKGKGFGFVSYSDPEDFLKAWKEMNGELDSFIGSNRADRS